MPQSIRFRITTLIIGLFSLQLFYAQSANDCLNIDDTGIIKRAYESFEKDLYSYYNFSNDSIKTYRTFLAEVASLSIDLRKFPSSNSIQLTREFKKLADNRNSIWIKLSDYENQEVSKKTSPSSVKNKNEEEILIFNYRRGFIQCLKNSSDSDDFRELITNLESDGNVSTSLIAQRIYYLVDKELGSLEVKKFIAFDIYYSILMVIEKAFG